MRRVVRAAVLFLALAACGPDFKSAPDAGETDAGAPDPICQIIPGELERDVIAALGQPCGQYVMVSGGFQYNYVRPECSTPDGGMWAIYFKDSEHVSTVTRIR